jgi:hypothetical protein
VELESLSQTTTATIRNRSACVKHSRLHRRPRRHHRSPAHRASGHCSLTLLIRSSERHAIILSESNGRNRFDRRSRRIADISPISEFTRLVLPKAQIGGRQPRDAARKVRPGDAAKRAAQQAVAGALPLPRWERRQLGSHIPSQFPEPQPGRAEYQACTKPPWFLRMLIIVVPSRGTGRKSHSTLLIIKEVWLLR